MGAVLLAGVGLAVSRRSPPGLGADSWCPAWEAPCPAETSGQPAAVAHQLAVGQLVHLAPGLDAARRDAEPAVRCGLRARVEAGARDEPGTQLLRQRVDLED